MTQQQLSEQQYFEIARSLLCGNCGNQSFLNSTDCRCELHSYNRFVDRFCPFCDMKVYTIQHTIASKKIRLVGAMIVIT